ncbi:hypothetical protein ACFT9I_20710 [Streptomyces sp. NPDC057137]|uniref:hypothetical protein n=1 Tax=Streptomyces sp. NPDC057137 TaxID=3346030 RepID=UPI00362887F7
MRSLVSSRAAAAAVCAALVLGTAGTAVATTAHETPAGVGADVARAPIADAEAIKQQTQTLASLSNAITPVTDLLTAVLKADNGQIAAADVQKHQAAIKKALDAVKNAAPANPAKPANPAGNAGNANPVNAVGADHKAPAAADVTAQAVASVQKATDALLKATTAKDATAVATQSKAVVTSLVNLTTALVMNGSLPAPNLPGLPELPKLPGAEAPAPAPELPGVPSTPKLP